jgi:hypothetical protein
MAGAARKGGSSGVVAVVLLLSLVVGIALPWLYTAQDPGDAWRAFVAGAWIAPLREGWSGALRPGLALLAALTTVAGLLTPAAPHLVRVRRVGIDGDELRVQVDSRAVTLLAACVFAALALRADAGPRAPAEPRPVGATEDAEAQPTPGAE